MSNIAIAHLIEAYRIWQRGHPPGFFARPARYKNGRKNMFVWNCVIPGVPETVWDEEQYTLILTFDNCYPKTPPTCRFSPVIPHYHVNENGVLSWPLFVRKKGWDPDMTIEQMLVGIQSLFKGPPNWRGCYVEPGRDRDRVHRMEPIEEED